MTTVTNNDYLRDSDTAAGIQYRYHITYRANRGAA